MPFDTELAIAAMPQANGQHPEELLRGRYPELAFLFDEMADLRYLVEGHDDDISSAHDAAYDEGHDTGHGDGHAKGYDAGYDAGYGDGVSEATE